MNKAHVVLTIKAVDDEARLIEGWATRPEKDRVGDIVVPTGVEYKLPLPFLLDHDHSQAVGEVDQVDVSDEGIKFRAHIKKIDEPGPVKEDRKSTRLNSSHVRISYAVFCLKKKKKKKKKKQS